MLIEFISPQALIAAIWLRITARRRSLKRWKDKNPEKRAAENKAYRKRNPEKVRARKKRWNKANPDPEGQHTRYIRWKNKNPDKYKAAYTIQNEKQEADPVRRLYNRVRANVSSALRFHRCLKSVRTLALIGLPTWEDFKAHLEQKFQPGMTWDNHGQGPGKWNIDHIRPCKNFLDLSDPEQQKQAWHYTNLQPLWWIDNMKKGAKYFSGI